MLLVPKLCKKGLPPRLSTPTVAELVLGRLKVPPKLMLPAEKLPLASRETMSSAVLLAVALDVTVRAPPA